MNFLPSRAAAMIAAVCAIGNSVPGGNATVVSRGIGVVHRARAAEPLQAGVAVGLRGDRGIGQLPHVEAQFHAVLGFPGGIVGHHVDVLAVAVGHRHVEALADRPAVAGVDHLVRHGAGRSDDVAASLVGLSRVSV